MKIKVVMEAIFVWRKGQDNGGREELERSKADEKGLRRTGLSFGGVDGEEGARRRIRSLRGCKGRRFGERGSHTGVTHLVGDKLVGKEGGCWPSNRDFGGFVLLGSGRIRGFGLESWRWCSPRRVHWTR